MLRAAFIAILARSVTMKFEVTAGGNVVGVYGVKANATTAEVDKVNSVETVVTEVARNKKKPMETKIANLCPSMLAELL